jgi:hypothetical protein
MSSGSPSPHPSPLTVRPHARTAGPGPDDQESRLLLECLPCGRITVHRPGPVTRATDGTVLLHWWSCTECPEGHALRR